MRNFLDHSGLLIIGAVIALVWANLARESYEPIAEGLRFAVNDIAMAFFFALAAKEVVEAMAPEGALHPLHRAALPLIAAVGGMAGPAALYLVLTAALKTPELAAGWAIPCATDIAFGYLAARLIFGARHPAVPFLLLLAIADDAIGLLIIGVFYPAGAVHLAQFGIILFLALGVAWALRRLRTVSFWPYTLGAGALSWLAFYRGGLHPALALVPIMPFLPHHTLHEFAQRWKRPVQIILGGFGLANAGMRISEAGAGTWMVLAAIILGKPLGILASVWVGAALGLKRPAGLTWPDLLVLGMIAGIGFTVALFFATASFRAGLPLDQAKMGALLSLSSGVLAALVARAFRVGRFTQNSTESSLLST